MRNLNRRVTDYIMLLEPLDQSNTNRVVRIKKSPHCGDFESTNDYCYALGDRREIHRNGGFHNTAFAVNDLLSALG